MSLLEKFRYSYLPQEPFEVFLPAPERGEEVVERALVKMKEDQKSWQEEQERRLDAAMIRVNACGFLRGFLTAFNPWRNKVGNHFSWCPAEAWLHRDFDIVWKVEQPIKGRSC